MSLWKCISSNPAAKQSMTQFYNDKGLADIRGFFAQWIEERIIGYHNNPFGEGYENISIQFYEDLKQKILSTNDGDVFHSKLSDACAVIRQLAPIDLYMHFCNGLQFEKQLLEQISQCTYMTNPALSNGGGGSCGTVVGDEGNLISGNSNLLLSEGGGMGTLAMNNAGNGNGNGGTLYNCGALYAAQSLIPNISLGINRIGTEIQQFRSNFETFSACLTSCNHRKPMMTPEEWNTTELQLQERCAILAGQRSNLIQALRRIVADYDAIQDEVIKELKNWQHSQALAGNGAPFRDNLDDIQRAIELLVENVNKILDQCTTLRAMSVECSDDINDVINRARTSQQLLVLSSFIVEKQPPQVMKTNTRFAAAVRWLIGPQLGINGNSPTVECVILSESQAKNHSAQHTLPEMPHSTPPSVSGEIINNISNMEYNNQNRVMCASFRTMQLKKIKRAEKKGTESVMDEKFALLFYTSLVVNDYKIRVWTLSLPVVVIVHGNQEPQSWATITWDNAFSEIVREPFQVPDRVGWNQLASALNTKFESSTGRRLTIDNLLFIYEKLFRHNAVSGDHKEYITWAQFCKEPLPERAFTFWDWFFAIMKLTKDHLLNIWKAGLIVGFINKGKADELLRASSVGTFLLRFSDSELGGITVGLVNEQNSVLMLSPWTARDLNIRCLADRIHDIDILHRIYPMNRLRDEVFAEFYTQKTDEVTRRDGYVANTIRAHVPAIENSIGSGTPRRQDIGMGALRCSKCMRALDGTEEDISMMITSNNFEDLCMDLL